MKCPPGYVHETEKDSEQDSLLEKKFNDTLERELELTLSV